jgi:hypothetical protein
MRGYYCPNLFAVPVRQGVAPTLSQHSSFRRDVRAELFPQDWAGSAGGRFDGATPVRKCGGDAVTNLSKSPPRLAGLVNVGPSLPQPAAQFAALIAPHRPTALRPWRNSVDCLSG